MSCINNDKVAILMATYQGECYVLEQLKSFEEQSHNNWNLIVSDDGSTDKTLSTIVDFATRNESKVEIIHGPRKGFVSNFLSLLFNKDIKADYYSFSDQDDIWHKEKLERAVSWLKTIPAHRPALYCSRTHLINNKGESLGFSPLFKRPPSFRNALAQNICSGNTMVLNEAARAVIASAGIANVVSHDWWIYILIAGTGGTVYYDPDSTLSYRQHGGNLIGTNIGLRARLMRLGKLFQGQYRNWNSAHIKELEKCIYILTPKNKMRFEWFKKIHTGNFFCRIYYFYRLGLYRQSAIDTFAVFISVLLKKV